MCSCKNKHRKGIHGHRKHKKHGHRRKRHHKGMSMGEVAVWGIGAIALGKLF